MDELPNIDYKSFAAKIKQKRLSLGLTQEKVAESLNLNESYYSRIERGDRALSVESLVNIANFYDLSLDWLLLDSTNSTIDSKIVTEIENIFRDKNPAETALLLNLLKVQAENVGRLLS